MVMSLYFQYVLGVARGIWFSNHFTKKYPEANPNDFAPPFNRKKRLPLPPNPLFLVVSPLLFPWVRRTGMVALYRKSPITAIPPIGGAATSPPTYDDVPPATGPPTMMEARPLPASCRGPPLGPPPPSSPSGPPTRPLLEGNPFLQ